MKFCGLKMVNWTEWVIAERVYYVIFPLALTSLYYSYRIHRLEKPPVMERKTSALAGFHEDWKANTLSEVAKLMRSEAYIKYLND